MGKRTQLHRVAAVGTPLGDDVLLLRQLSGTEELGRPFHYELEMVSEDNEISFDDIVGQNITVRFELPRGGTRFLNGYVSRFVQTDPLGRLPQYRASVVPWLWILTRSADCRIFQKMKVPDIIKQVFRDFGLTDFSDSLTGSCRTWEYCVQYRETAFNFVSRLMEHEGIYYYFEHENGKHTLVLADDMAAHQPYPSYGEISYRSRGEDLATMEHVREWTLEKQVQPGAYALNAFDFEAPKKALLARSKTKRDNAMADFEVYDYPGAYVERSDGDNYTRVREEELQAEYEVAKGHSDARGIGTGYTFQLTEHPRQDQCREYLVTSTEYKFVSDEFEPDGVAGAKGTVCACELTAIPTTEQFRARRVTSKPRVRGPQTAIVVGKKGEEIWTDKHGRVKVQFHWDRYSKADENSSCWIRVAQAWAGKTWGAIFIPRIGQEVIIDFLEGDPDRPIITGRVYNGLTKPPYDLPAKATVSTIKSNSSKGGGGFNEIRFEDKKGKEQIFVHAQKDQDLRVENIRREWIGKDRHLIVKKKQYELVEKDKHSTVKGDQCAKVGGDLDETIEGTRTVSVGKDEHLSVGNDRLQEIGDDDSLKVAENLSQQAGKKISIKAGTNYHEKAGKNYAMDAGMEVHIKGGIKVVIEGGVQVSLKAGPSFVDIGPAGVAISGPMVMINSGGAAGSGSGSKPKAPGSPEKPDPPKEPKEADKAKPGEVAAPAPPSPPTPVVYTAAALVPEMAAEEAEPSVFSAAVEVLKTAAEEGIPFCEKCEEARRQMEGGGG